MTKTEKKIQDRLAMLSFYITKYSNLWNKSPSKSPRLSNWVHEYNTIQSNMPYEQWKNYCDKWEYAYSHNGYDFL